VSAHQLPDEPQQVVRGDTREPRNPRGDEQSGKHHEPKHSIGIGSRRRDLKRLLRVHPCLGAFSRRNEPARRPACRGGIGLPTRLPTFERKTGLDVPDVETTRLVRGDRGL